MILHLVLLRFKPGTTAQRIAGLAAALLDMKGPIPEILDIRWGANLGPSATEYPHALTVTFDDLDALERYLVHPVHRRVVAEHLEAIREAKLAVDIEA
ncbi:MAG TPA: Dabb family protein [Gemmatimonadales bacterium]|nr:Dabb family protein [Gemmatimonadales bacterium]